MNDAGHDAVEVSDAVLKDAQKKDRDGYIVRVASSSALSGEKAQAVSNEFALRHRRRRRSKKARWSGDAFHIRTTSRSRRRTHRVPRQAGARDEALDRRARTDFRTVRAGTNEYEAVGEVHGLVRNVQQPGKALGTRSPSRSPRRQRQGRRGAAQRRQPLHALRPSRSSCYIALRLDLRYGPARVAALFVNNIITGRLCHHLAGVRR